MRALHILRSMEDERALATALSHAADHPTSLLLLQDAVLARVDGFPGPVYASAEDVAARGKGGTFREVDYEAIVNLIFEHDRVITW
ncbi:MAG: DsrH/TusB family sulfur relay protein [Sphingomonadaceae bacterium]